MKRVDYDERLYRVYAQGRALSEAQAAVWAAAFGRHLSDARPLCGADVGSGTGRFTALLADAFGGPIIGIEPSDRMRAVATGPGTHPGVRYEKGGAECIPLGNGSVDFALLYLSWHHVSDKPAAVRELLRIVRPGGTVLLRSQFADRMPDLWWLDAFPGGRGLDAALYQPLAEVTSMFGATGWIVGKLDEVQEASSGTRAARLVQLRTRSLSLFEHFTEEQTAAGFAELERRVAADPEIPVPPMVSDLLVLHRPE